MTRPDTRAAASLARHRVPPCRTRVRHLWCHVRASQPFVTFSKKGKISFGNLHPQQKFQSFQITISTCFTKHSSVRGFQNHVYKKYTKKKKKANFLKCNFQHFHSAFPKSQYYTFNNCTVASGCLVCPVVKLLRRNKKRKKKKRRREKYSILQIKQWLPRLYY